MTETPSFATLFPSIPGISAPGVTRSSPRGERPLSRGWFGASLLAAALCLLLAPPAALANDDDELTFEQRIINNLLGGASRPPIDYRERSPLVIPPSHELPSPSTGASVQGNQAWPRDPDQQRQRRSANRGDAIERFERDSNPLSPDELRRGARAGGGRHQAPAQVIDERQQGNPMTPSQLGETRSLFGLLGRAVTPEQIESFSGEPQRQRLTEPPTGYRTPSTEQPYQPPGSQRARQERPRGFDPAGGVAGER